MHPFTNYPLVSTKQHAKDVQSGEDVVGLTMIEDNTASKTTAPSSLSVRQFSFPDISKHQDREKLNQSLIQIEKRSSSIAREFLLAKAIKGAKGKSKSKTLRARQTEVLGELAAMKKMVKMEARPLAEISPGHGRGFDQIWQRQKTIIVVEAKGPGAKLNKQTGQMSRQWILDVLKREKTRKKAAKKALAALEKNELRKMTVTAVAVKGRLGASGKSQEA